MANNIDEGSVSWNLKVKTDDAEKKIDKLSGSVQNLHKLFGLFKVSVFVKGLQSIGTTIGKMTEKQMQYIQTQNIFNKTMGEFTQTATKFRDNMESRLGMDPQQIMDSMSAFRRLTETFGIASDRADLMSTNLTQLASDMTAYGYSFDNAMQKLKSGISGEIEPMRAMGVALDKATLQQTLYAAGIDRTYDSLTRAQKTELLYYQIMTQTKNMQGELARTMASPANMARIMKQEFTQLGRAIGSIFIPLAMKVIPVIRAITQELIRLARWLAGKAGFNIADYTTDYTAGFEDMAGGISDVEESANGAAKALNKMLMPFDELNNINTSSASGAGGAGGVGGGGSLFEDLPSYDIFEGLSDSMNKNVESIKAKIEELLPVIKAVGVAIGTAFALTKLVDFLDWLTRVDKALSVFGKLGGLVEIGLGALLTISGIWTQWQGTKKLLNGDYSIWAVLETIGGTAIGTLGIVSILKGIQKFGGLKTLSTGNMVGIGLGVMLTIQAIQVITDAIKSGNIRQQILGILEGGIGLGLITWNAGVGTVLLPLMVDLTIGYGMITWADENSNTIRKMLYDTENEEDLTWYQNLNVGINALGKGVNDTIASLTGLDLALEAMKSNGYVELFKFDENSKYLTEFNEKVKTLTKSYKNLKQSILDTRDAKLLEVDENIGYLESLDKIIDENGKVKDGYSELAEFILKEFSDAFDDQYELIDGVIYKNGEAISSYAEFRDSIDKNIQKMKEEAEQAANLDLYKQAYEQRKKLETEYKNMLLEREKAEIELLKAVEDGIDTQSDEYKELRQHFEETSQASADLAKEINKNYGEITDYSIQAFGTLYDSLEEGNDVQGDYLKELFKNNQETWNKIYQQSDEDQQKMMLKMTTNIDNWTPEMQSKWQEMAEKFPEEFGAAYNEMLNMTNKTMQNAENAVQKSNLPKNSADVAKNAKNKFSNEFNIDSIVTTKVKSGANAITNNSYLFANSGSVLVNKFLTEVNNADTYSVGANMVYGIAGGIEAAKNGQRLNNALGNLASKLVTKMTSLLGIHSPSTVMRDQVGKFIPLGLAAGIDMEADSVSESMKNLSDRVRIDQQDFDFYSSADLVSSINGKINAQTVAALNGDTLQDMTNATYEAMSRALIESNEDFNPQFNVYVGNDKVYSGYGKQQNRESNMYGVRV